MDVPAPTTPGAADGRYTAEEYLRLVDEGVLGPDDRVELLEGVVVAMAYRRSLATGLLVRATR